MYGSRALSALTQAGIFSSCTEAHLRVGHTHEDVDSLFSLVTSALQSTPASNLQTPRDLQKVIDSKLSSIFHGKDQAWGIELVETVTLNLLNAGPNQHYFFVHKVVLIVSLIFPKIGWQVEIIYFQFLLGTLGWPVLMPKIA